MFCHMGSTFALSSPFGVGAIEQHFKVTNRKSHGIAWNGVCRGNLSHRKGSQDHRFRGPENRWTLLPALACSACLLSISRTR